MLNGRFALFAIWLSAIASLISACSKSSLPTSSNTTPELNFCSTAIIYSAPVVTISGTANFNRRNVTVISGTTVGLGSADPAHSTARERASQKPIRQAEVRVTDSAGKVAQCATTNDLGQFTFDLPQNSGTYTINVNSRADNAYLKVSVLNSPSENKYYSLTSSVSSASSSSDTSLVAQADGDILGGAFNIMDQIYEANRFLRAKVANCSAAFQGGCYDVNLSQTIPKVSAYWMKGFNPASYYGDPNTGSSFYIPGEHQLYILGGLNGDVNTADTDHFDDSVILHEYGHFLEDAVGTSDSPGGSHNGLDTVDPRLAWSEGWGNFFQGAVRGDNSYIDTQGNLDGTRRILFNVNLETVTPQSYGDFSETGESNFLEFAVTRLLWDVVDNTNSETNGVYTDNITDAFADIWAAFTSATYGFGQTTNPAAGSSAAEYAFRNTGLLNLVQDRYRQKTWTTNNWTNIKGLNGHGGSRTPYGTPLSTAACTSPSYGSYYYQLTPSSNDDGFYRNNDYYYFKAPAGGTHTIQLEYAKQGAIEPDLDIYIYNEDHLLDNMSDLVGYSRRGTNEANHTTEPATVSLTSGAKYLVRINADVSGASPGSQAYYNLSLDGAPLCPSTIVPQ